jgi:hypothetical protein
MKVLRAATYLAALVSCLLVSACAQAPDEASQTKAKSTEPTPVAMEPALTPIISQPNATPGMKAQPMAPPTPDEVKTAVARIFAKTALPDFSRKPSFMTGDFNGDASEDLAVLIKPSKEQLSEINNELANWVLEDPTNVTQRQPKRATQPKPVRAEEDDVLLAVIHGAGAKGWRDPDAKQTYLLKNREAANMVAQTITAAQTTNDKGKLPSLRGDIISENLSGKAGIIYWNGSKYAWYSIPSK